MRSLLLIVCCGLGVGLATPALADGAGGPVPPLQGGAGVSAPGSDLGYVAVWAGRDATVVERVRRGSGYVERSRVLRGSFGVPGIAYDGSSTGLSADGRTLVLAETINRYPVRRTRLVVMDARRLLPRGRVMLRGFSTVDAVSPDGRWLYLIHYTSRDQSRYAVRAYDLRARRLLPRPVIDPREPDEAMQGIPLTRVMSADGRWAYTLYDRPDEAPFVHALDTRGRTARCIDLPSLSGEELSAVRLALGAAGATLRVEREGAPLALVDTRTFAVREPAATPRSSPARPASESGDGDDGGGVLWALWAVPLAGLAAIALGLRRRRRQRVTLTS
jgi:MYXO-CTERM domain-containing protein